MIRLVGEHSFWSAWQRLLRLIKGVGLAKTIAMLLSILDDHFLKCFDRSYRIRTSGSIQLGSTSFAQGRLADATSYSPVNGWAMRKLLRKLALPKTLRFADLGCGLGRPGILAAEYGFSKVTGVELAHEFCVAAENNVIASRLPTDRKAVISILEMDVLDFCQSTTDDIFFMYRPFSEEFLRRVLEMLVTRAEQQKKIVTVIFSERLMHSNSYRRLLADNPQYKQVFEYASWGQAFYVYQCGQAAVTR